MKTYVNTCFRVINDILPSGLLLGEPLVISIPTNESKNTNEDEKKIKEVSAHENEKNEEFIEAVSIDPNFEFFNIIKICSGVVYIPNTETETENIPFSNNPQEDMNVLTNEGSLFINILTNLIVKTLYQQISVHLADIEMFLNNSLYDENMNIENNDDNNHNNDNDYINDTCNEYISHKLHRKSLKKCYNNNNSHHQNLHCTEMILKKIIHFVMISDQILQSQISPSSQYNQSLSINSYEKTRLFLGEILISHINNPLTLFTNFSKYQNIINNPPTPLSTQNGVFMYPTGVLPQKEGILLPSPIYTKLIKFVGRGNGNGADHSAECYESSDMLSWLTNVINVINTMDSCIVSDNIYNPDKLSGFGSGDRPPVSKIMSPLIGDNFIYIHVFMYTYIFSFMHICMNIHIYLVCMFKSSKKIKISWLAYSCVMCDAFIHLCPYINMYIKYVYI